MFFSKKEGLIFPESIEIRGVEYLVDVTFHKKRSSSVSIKTTTLHFRLSSYLSSKQAKDHFGSLLNSISKKIEKTNIVAFSFKEIVQDGQFEFAGNVFKIYFHEKRITKLVGDTFYVDKSLSLEQMEKKIEKLILKHYSSNLINYVQFVNDQTYRYPISGVVIKNVSSKWGHCTSRNEILINIKLLNTSKEILDYVIFHELSHVKFKNHSASFWGEVSRFCPNYKELRSLLKKDPPSLFKKIE